MPNGVKCQRVKNRS